MKKVVVHKRIGRYALLEQIGNSPEPWVVACGFNPETEEWNQGRYFHQRGIAEMDFTQQSRICFSCSESKSGCVVCRIPNAKLNPPLTAAQKKCIRGI